MTQLQEFKDRAAAKAEVARCKYDTPAAWLADEYDIEGTDPELRGPQGARDAAMISVGIEIEKQRRADAEAAAA